MAREVAQGACLVRVGGLVSHTWVTGTWREAGVGVWPDVVVGVA